MAFDFDNEANRFSRMHQDIQGWLREIFLKDWGLKLIALAVTLALWFGVTGQRTNATKTVNGIKLSFALPPDMSIGNDYRDEVNITISGDKSEIAKLDERSLVATVDVSNFQAGEKLIQLTTKTVSLDLPAGVKIEAITPNAVSIFLEPSIKKEIEIEPQFIGKLPDGYELREVKITPPKIEIIGPESRVKAFDKAPTAKIHLDGLKTDYTVTQVAIDIRDDKISVAGADVIVQLKIGERKIERSFDNVAVMVASGGQARPEKASVTLYGEKSLLEKLREEEIQIMLDVAGDGSITPRLVVPQNLEGKVELRSTKPSGFSIIR